MLAAAAQCLERSCVRRRVSSAPLSQRGFIGGDGSSTETHIGVGYPSCEGTAERGQESYMQQRVPEAVALARAVSSSSPPLGAGA